MAKVTTLWFEQHILLLHIRVLIDSREFNAGGYPMGAGFPSCKAKPWSISTPPGWDASPLQVTLPYFVGFPNNSPVPIYTPGWREEQDTVSLSRVQSRTTQSRDDHEATTSVVAEIYPGFFMLQKL